MNTRRIQLLSVSVAVACLVGAPLVVAQTTPEYDAGLLYFHAGRFAEAAAYLQQATLRHPYNALVHYNLANALVKARVHDRAMQEYRLAYLLEPQGSVAGYCTQALKGYNAKVPTPAEAVAFQRKLRDTAGGAALGPLPPTMTDSDVDRTIAAIRRQVQQEKLKHSVKGNASALSAEQVAKEKIKTIDRDTQVQVDRLYSPTVEIIDEYGRVKLVANMLYNPYTFANPHVLKEKEAQIRARGEAAKEDLWREAKLDRERYETWAKAQEDALDEIAASLTSQFNSKSKGGVQLQPRGTNLYVKQYVPFSSKAASNARSATCRIVRAGSAASDEPKTPQPLREEQAKPDVRRQTPSQKTY
jgi:tetratricopeptide (TPR) repeat protein